MNETLRVLIIEDDDDDAALLLRELKRGGYEVTWRRVCTPAAMSEALDVADWDIAISDWSMPAWRGIDAFQLLRTRGLDIPFIIVSGTINEDIAVEALRAGVHDFMQKGKFARLLPAIERERRDAEMRRSRREAEAALEKQRTETERSEHLLRLVLENVPDGVTVTDERGRFVLSNPAAVSLLGKLDDDVDPATWPEHFGVYQTNRTTPFPAEELALMQALNGRAVDAQEEFLRRPGAAEGRFVSVNARPLLDAKGGIRGAVAVLRDVTKERAGQEQLMISDRMASIGMLAAGVGHEINNPLTAVLGNLDLARNQLQESAETGVDTADLTRMLDDAGTAAERVRMIVRDLRIFSRHQETQIGPVALQPILESSARMAWNQIRHRARLETSFGPVPLVDGAESRLGQVLLNLIINAAQAMPEGQFDTNVLRVGTYTDAERRAVVEISDTGCGMSPETLQQLFRPFFTTKAVGVGTGLGLAICHRIVDALGGEIAVESELGKGTTFRVILPASKQSYLPPLLEAAPLVPAPRRAHILAIDDEPMIVSLINDSLRHQHQITTTTLGADALALVRGGATFDVILCDVMMPGMSGMELYSQLLAHDPRLSERVIFMTGGAFSNASRDFLESIDNVLVEKPFDSEVLCNAVNTLLTRSEPLTTQSAARNG